MSDNKTTSTCPNCQEKFPKKARKVFCRNRCRVAFARKHDSDSGRLREASPDEIYRMASAELAEATITASDAAERVRVLRSVVEKLTPEISGMTPEISPSSAD